MHKKDSIRDLVRKIVSEQTEDYESYDTGTSYESPLDQDDWSSPTGRKSNAYKAAEAAATQNPRGLLERLGATSMETPSTGTVKDVENFLRQVIMKNSDLSMVYSTVKSSNGNVYVERRRGSGQSYSEEFSFMTSNAAAARYVSLLLVAGGAVGWVKYKPEVDTVMFGGQNKSIIRVMPNSYSNVKSAPSKPAPEKAPSQVKK